MACRRFDDFAAELGAPRTVLADRLKRLTAAGLLARRDYREPGRRARPEYWLTPKGAELRLPFVALTQWGDLWLAGGEPPPVAMRSRATGEAAARRAGRWLGPRGRGERAEADAVGARWRQGPRARLNLSDEPPDRQFFRQPVPLRPSASAL